MNEAFNSYKEKNKKLKRKNKRGPVISSLVTLASIAFIIYCVCSYVLTQVGIADKKNELTLLNEKAFALEEENDEYQRILAEEDERTYMERIAIDTLGYAYPNERRFYDTARN